MLIKHQICLIVALFFISAYGLHMFPFNKGSSDIPEMLFAGEVHYSRIPVEYWDHRIKMIKALGLNSLSVYIMWNYHEVSPGKFDYQTSNRNLSYFLELAQKNQMKVLIRPGPYVCAEWDFGGLPARLLSISDLVIRANNEKFLSQVEVYFKSLAETFKKHAYSDQNPNGSIVLLQIQNQYGFYGEDKSYIEALRKMWIDLDVNIPQYYVDWVENIRKCHWSGANIGINNGVTKSQWDYVKTIQSKGYLLGGQIYSGWLTHWSEKWQSKSLDKNIEEYGFLMHNNHSYSMYMVHGGTNFGLTAGANAFVGEEFNYRGHVTSYDYDAPINEQGSKTAKFEGLRNLIKPYAKWTIPDPPKPIPTMILDSFTPISVASLGSNLGEPKIKNSQVLYPFESTELSMFNQGIVVYETQLSKRVYFFKARVHDFAIVQLDGMTITTLDRSQFIEHYFKIECAQEKCVLRIIVEAMGHINFDHQMENDFKGLLDIDDDLASHFTWNMYTVPLNENIFKWKNKTTEVNSTTLLRGTVNVSLTPGQQPGDTYLDMSNFVKGYLWVNGYNLGRYWNKGPQTRLFCPGVWLKQGENQIHILQLQYDQKPHQISSHDTLKSY